MGSHCGPPSHTAVSGARPMPLNPLRLACGHLSLAGSTADSRAQLVLSGEGRRGETRRHLNREGCESARGGAVWPSVSSRLPSLCICAPQLTDSREQGAQRGRRRVRRARSCPSGAGWGFSLSCCACFPEWADRIGVQREVLCAPPYPSPPSQELRGVRVTGLKSGEAPLKFRAGQ
ncbi:hypothetical protein AGOR_G00138280 [Albula goreensis]|uniref:Uncharacterized protein n=1 Tax=Albula goreensis TaxID=1534307 RepID=A0A8T3D9P8_9TELE|nr:hypothetical protein AGOR_G00138280 [Albula goreensis]